MDGDQGATGETPVDFVSFVRPSMMYQDPHYLRLKHGMIL